MKDRVTLTLDKNILEKIDERVDGVKIKNRSHAVELLLMRALSSNRLRKAVILAAGSKSEYVEPLSMRLVLGKPILQWNIELLKRHGVKEFMICMSEHASAIKDYLGNGEKFGIKVQYSEQEYPLGTAGSLKQISEFVTETVLVCNADDLKNINLDEMYEFHKDGNKTCTIALTTTDDPSKYGVALMNGTKIITFIEKPAKETAPSNLINSGLYIVEPEVLKFIPDGFSVTEVDVFPKLADQDRLFGYIFSGQWFPTKTEELYAQAVNNWKGLPD